jgi:hypothetical protein
MFVMNKNKTIKPIWKTFQIIAKDFMMKTSTHPNDNGAKVPNRFDAHTGGGFSDHLPLSMMFDI